MEGPFSNCFSPLIRMSLIPSLLLQVVAIVCMHFRKSGQTLDFPCSLFDRLVWQEEEKVVENSEGLVFERMQ